MDSYETPIALHIYHAPARPDTRNAGKVIDLITTVVSALGMTAAIFFMLCL